mmetsp:Transcript_17933/g.27431  ORF Transcript_17933/g.27431 Transcript_17933/m.27431 type:complete len:191 (+) Transcript_17933:266-838(+)
MPKNEPVVVRRKVAVLGFRAVGKSSLTNAFVHGTYSETYYPTIESTFHKTIRFRRVHFATDIVDIAGMDEHTRLSRNVLLGAQGYVLLFSIVSRPSFEKIQSINDVLLNSLGDAPDVPRVLVGGMHELADRRKVGIAEAQSLADSWRIPYLECSSKTGENVAEVFHTLMKEIEKDGLLLSGGEENSCCLL